MNRKTRLKIKSIAHLIKNRYDLIDYDNHDEFWTMKLLPNYPNKPDYDSINALPDEDFKGRDELCFGKMRDEIMSSIKALSVELVDMTGDPDTETCFWLTFKENII